MRRITSRAFASSCAKLLAHPRSALPIRGRSDIKAMAPSSQPCPTCSVWPQRCGLLPARPQTSDCTSCMPATVLARPPAACCGGRSQLLLCLSPTGAGAHGCMPSSVAFGICRRHRVHATGVLCSRGCSSPRRVRRRTRKPCAKTRLGSGSPALSSMPGQYTAWKRRMSLPTRCTSAGQPRAASSAPSGGVPSGSSAAAPHAPGSARGLC